MLGERCGKSLKSEPFCEGCLKSEEVAGFGWVEGTVPIGTDKDADMWWQRELVESEYVVVVVGGGCVWLDKKRAEMGAGTREIRRVRRCVKSLFPGAVVVELRPKGLVASRMRWVGRCSGMARCLCCWMVVRSHCWQCLVKSSCARKGTVSGMLGLGGVRLRY